MSNDKMSNDKMSNDKITKVKEMKRTQDPNDMMTGQNYIMTFLRNDKI
jgi:hypothetical protein